MHVTLTTFPNVSIQTTRNVGDGRTPFSVVAKIPGNPAHDNHWGSNLAGAVGKGMLKPLHYGVIIFAPSHVFITFGT